MNPLLSLFSSKQNTGFGSQGGGSFRIANTTVPYTLPPSKTTTPAPTITSSSPAATNPVPPKPAPASTTPAKQQFVQTLASAPTGNTVAATTGTPLSATGNFTTPSGAVVNGGSGAMVTPPPVDPKASYRSAYDSYIASLVPSDSETTASKYLNELVLQSKKDYEAALDRPGQTLGFATGEAARVNKNNSFAIDAATNSLNALTGARTATSTADKARVDFEKSMLPEDKSISDTYGTGSIGEYNFAKSQGYAGSFTDYQNEDANRKAKAAGSGTTTPKVIGSESAGYYTLNPDGSVTPLSLKPTVSWAQYLKAASQELGMDINPDSDTYKQLKSQYDQAYTKTAVGGSGANDWGL